LPLPWRRAAALALAQLLTSLLFGAEPRYPLTFAAAAAPARAAALFAGLIPARCASGIHPMEAFVMTKLAVLLLPLSFATAEDRGNRVESQLRETIPFIEGGSLYVDNSFGDLRVEAWDRSDVEISLRKRTNRRYDSNEEWKGRRELDDVRIDFRRSGDRVELRTQFPDRGLSRMLRGKSNVDLRYHIKVPRKTNLHIRHDIGEVRIAGVHGDHDVTASIGEIGLNLPEQAEFRFDARARIGDVHSDYAGRERRASLLGARFDTPGRQTGHQVTARVGIGSVEIYRGQRNTHH
jgi:hypothetical protein